MLAALHAFAGMHLTAKVHELCVIYMRSVMTCNVCLCMCTDICYNAMGFVISYGWPLVQLRLVDHGRAATHIFVIHQHS